MTPVIKFTYFMFVSTDMKCPKQANSWSQKADEWMSGPGGVGWGNGMSVSLVCNNKNRTDQVALKKGRYLFFSSRG